MKIANKELLEFLEAALRDTIEFNPKKVVVSYIDENDGIVLSYSRCGYADLQRIGQEFINEGTLMLIAQNEERIEQLKEELEEEDE